MKSKIRLFQVVCIIILTSFACSKYEEGPAISLKSPEKRISGIWLLDKYFVNDMPISLNELGIEIWQKEYNIDGTGIQTISSIGFDPVIEEFEWEFDPKKENIRERFKSSNNEWGEFSDYNKILRLSSEDFWIINFQGHEEIKYFFVKQ